MFFSKKKNNDASQNDDRIKVDTTTITTMVGADTCFEGKLVTKASVRINGTVKGDVRADGVVILTKTGRIEGTIEADSIIVAGVIEGNMSIRDKVNVEASGEIYGDVITKKFVIDEESIFQGNCIMNRDGKVIPVPPYVKESDKQAEEDKKKDTEKKDKDKKEESKSESEKKDDLKDKESDDKRDEDESEVVDEKESDEEQKTDDSEADEVDKSDDEDEEAEEKSEEIIIADINDVEAADDIPASDNVGMHGRNKNKKHKGNYVKKSRSLSVEIENE